MIGINWAAAFCGRSSKNHINHPIVPLIRCWYNRVLSMRDTLIRSRPLVIGASTEAQVYGLFALAMGLTVLGVYGGMQFFTVLFGSGLVWLLVIAEFGIILTSGLWMDRSPLNYVLFGIFPLLSGLTITPFILHVLTGYANGGAILVNALLSTTFMGLAACVFARTTT